MSFTLPATRAGASKNDRAVSADSDARGAHQQCPGNVRRLASLGALRRANGAVRRAAAGAGVTP